MMLIRSLPTSIDDHAKQKSSCVWLSSDESWQEPTNPIPVTKHHNTNNTFWSHNLLTSSQLSTEVNMSETPSLGHVYKRRPTSSTPTLVYKRRKVQHDSCSSSKSNFDHMCLKQQPDDVGECSSSSVVVTEGTNSCLLFLKQHGVIKRHVSSSTKKPTNDNDFWCLKACKVCDRITKTLNMLICDLCEEAFHMSCCNPVVRKVPLGEWFCGSCLRKKMVTSGSELGDGCLGPIELMLNDLEPFKSDVRIGEDFQAEVPDWSGALTDEISDYLEPTEVSPLECASYQERNSIKLSRLSPIGNWLQCREAIDGSVCGKWRRAPLFEVQSDDWDCFSSVLWDPSHADCAVPQEVDTDQVLKQLKYIEMLRPRISSKKWKLGVKKCVNQKEHPVEPRNEKEHTTDPRNTQKT